ncbi:MAG: NUDIX domain-containing protein [Candidatus Woykebacteria bacterium]
MSFDRKAYALEELARLLSTLGPEARILTENLPYSAVVGWPFVRSDGSAGMQTRTRVWDGAFAFALDEETHKMFVVRQQRETPDGLIRTVEIPGGGIDPGNSPLEQAIAELKEETGVVPTSDEVHQFGPVKGFNPIDGLIWTEQYPFLFPKARKELEPESGHEVHLMSISEIIEMDNKNFFRDPYSPYVVRRIQDWLKKNRPELLT